MVQDDCTAFWLFSFLGAGVVVQDVCLDWTLARSYMRLRFMPHQCVLLKVTRIYSRDHLDRVMQTQASVLNARVRARALLAPLAAASPCAVCFRLHASVGSSPLRSLYTRLLASLRRPSSRPCLLPPKDLFSVI